MILTVRPKVNAPSRPNSSPRRSVFQQHVKSNGLSHEQLREAAAKDAQGHADRLTRFLALFERIADEWERRLRKLTVSISTTCC
jgi:hypothetical protein